MVFILIISLLLKFNELLGKSTVYTRPPGPSIIDYRWPWSLPLNSVILSPTGKFIRIRHSRSWTNFKKEFVTLSIRVQRVNCLGVLAAACAKAEVDSQKYDLFSSSGCPVSNDEGSLGMYFVQLAVIMYQYIFG